MSASGANDLEEEEEDEGEAEENEDGPQFVNGKKKRTVAFMPTVDSSHGIFYAGHWLKITRCKRTTDWGSVQELKISVVARNNNVIKQLVLEAKKLYEKDAEHRVHIFMADEYGGWRWNGARQKRPLSSIVLEDGVKQMLIADCKDFMRSEEWYAERGIPFRRGYLLHGVPGSGKTSLIHAIAGELGLDIYCLSLSQKGMSDTMLSGLMGRVPTRCIVLLEDLDAAFTKSTSRDSNSTGVPTVPTVGEAAADGNTLSLSGLLNSIDGISATEGRLLFATTNYLDRLDSALSRPGRMDVWVNFTNATRWQAEGIFKCFFPSRKQQEEAANSDDGHEAALEITPPATPAPTAAKVSSSWNPLSWAGATAVPPSAIAITPVPKKKKAGPQVPLLEDEEIAELAKEFAAAIPEDEMSVASLQGYLLKNKTRPREAVKEVAAWVVKERELKAKLKREKEAAEKKEREEKAAKEAKEKAEAKDTDADAKVAEPSKPRRRSRRHGTVAVPIPAPIPPPAPIAPPTPSATSTDITDESSSASSESESENEPVTAPSSPSDKEKPTAPAKEKTSKEKQKWVAVPALAEPRLVPATAP
jgi:chaperone BCS1